MLQPYPMRTAYDDNSMNGNCDCIGAGWCERFRRSMTQRDYELCSNTCPGGCPREPNDSASYRDYWAAQTQKDRRHESPEEAAKPPSLTQQLTSAAIAYTRWIVAGCPRPTLEQLTDRLAACNTCPHLIGRDGGEKRCGLCGCPINKVAHLFGTVERPGKAEMATEVCPDTLPRWRSLTVI